MTQANAAPKRQVSAATGRRVSCAASSARRASGGAAHKQHGKENTDVDYGVAVVGIFGARRNCLFVSDRSVAPERQASSRSARPFRSGVAAGFEQRRPELDERGRQFCNWRFDLGLDLGGIKLVYRLCDLSEQAV